MRRNRIRSLAASLMIATAFAPTPTYAWGTEGHRVINRLAASTLPADVPAFLHSESAVDEIEYLGPEPDRWRSHSEPELSAAQAPEHFIDFEPADALGPLPSKRLDFEALVYAHGERPEKVGLQPWETTEVWERLKAAFREYRHLTAAHKDTHAVEQATIFYAGWLGHYVGDGSQPLHTTINYDGWSQKENPKEFSSTRGIHWRFEGPFVRATLSAGTLKSGDTQKKMTEPRLISGDLFDGYVAYLRHSATLVDTVYAFDKQGAFEKTGTEESRAFTEERLAAGASMLRDMIYTAWVESEKPTHDRY